VCARPAWIRGIEHRIEAHSLGVRDLTRSESTALAAAAAGALDGKVDIAELHAQFSHEELILAEALGLDPAVTNINPSGGALAGNCLMAAGLERFGEAAKRIWTGEADRAIAHATSGPCLQHNMVAVLEGN
jgi:acetyl-CoA acetyltransferase